MIINGDDVNDIAMLKNELAQQFDMKDLVPLRYFLGNEIVSSRKGYLLSQYKYKVDILQQAQLIDTQTVDTLLQLNAWYAPKDDTLLPDPTLYQTLVSRSIYLIITCLNISYAMHIVIQFVASPTIIHWVAILCILHYLWGTLCQSLVFPSTFSLELCAYYDLDQVSDSIDHKSTIGFCILLGRSLISWKSKKQNVVS